MKKLAKNPLMWIVLIGAGLITAILWALRKAKEAIVD